MHRLAESSRPDGVLKLSKTIRHFSLDIALTAELHDSIQRSLSSLHSFLYHLDVQRNSLREHAMSDKLIIRSLSFPELELVHFVTKSARTLKEVEIYANLATASYSVVAKCTQLQRLSISSTDGFEDSHLEELVKNAPSLESLQFRKCSAITDAGLEHIQGVRKLRDLGLFQCDNISGDAIRALGNLEMLRSLDLMKSRFRVQDIRSLTGLKNLKCLKLSAQMDAESFDIICEEFEKLEELRLGDCDRLTDVEGVNFRLLDNLKKLSIDRCNGFTDLTFEEGLRPLALECLTVGSCPVTDIGLSSINAYRGRLRKLSLWSCRNITDAGLSGLLGRGRFLEKLYLNFCTSLSDKFLTELEHMCPRLASLHIEHCFMSDATADSFKKQQPLVSMVNLENLMETAPPRAAASFWSSFVGQSRKLYSTWGLILAVLISLLAWMFRG